MCEGCNGAGFDYTDLMATETSRRIVAGDYRWGYVQVGYARQWVRRRLVVYPPGTSPAQRRWMQIWRWTPLAVAILVFGAAFLAGLAGATLIVAFATAGAASVTLIVLAAARTHTVRHATASVEGWTGCDADLRSLANLAVIRRISNDLRDADAQLQAGLIDAVEHEVIWARCHADMSEVLARTAPRRAQDRSTRDRSAQS